MLKRAVSTLLILAIVLIVLPAASMTADAADIPSSWAVSEVNNAIELGIVPADLKANYDSPITRADFCKAAIAFIEAKTGDAIETVCARFSVNIDYEAFSDTSEKYVAQIAALSR